MVLLVFSALFVFTSCNKDEKETGVLQLAGIDVATATLDLQGANDDIPVCDSIIIRFNNILDLKSLTSNIFLITRTEDLNFQVSLKDDGMTVLLRLDKPLEYSTSYLLRITAEVKGSSGEKFPGIEVNFSTEDGILQITRLTLNGKDFLGTASFRDVDRENIRFEIDFNFPLDPGNYQSSFSLTGYPPLNFELSGGNSRLVITNGEALTGYSRYFFIISAGLKAANGFPFDGFSNPFITSLDSSYKFPAITDEQLLDLVQEQTFRYFYEFAHPASGMARERNTSGDIVTLGGSGFGVMSLIVGMERGFITRNEGTVHLDKILTFLETCDRFHGAWPHWVNGNTGKTVPFTTNDDGADLVETSFMMQGLLTMRQYLNTADPGEALLISRINTLFEELEFDWFTRSQDVLYWHWSPNVGWAMNMKIEGYNETLIIYVLAASSPTHTISADVYHKGYARNGSIMSGNTYYGYILPLGYGYGGPLFFTHYSHLGLDPRNLKDTYADYWVQNVNQSLINWSYCIDNPKNFIGYSEDCWGLTASDNPWGYSAHSPNNDKGVITPTAAISSLPYTPEQSMAAIRHFYYLLGDRLWGEYGFYDAFAVDESWWASSYIAIDQGPIVCMIENYRTGLLWNLFMTCPEVQQGLDKLGFTY